MPIPAHSLLMASLSVPTVSITDSFDRADSTTSLGSTDTGQAWTANAGTWGITGNRAYMATSGGGVIDIATIDAGISNCIIEVVTGTFTTPSQNAGIVFRYVDNDNFWRWIVDHPNNDLYLQKRVAGTFTTVYQNTSAGISNGKILQAAFNGDAIEAMYNGVVEYLSTGHTEHQTATRHGLAVAGTQRTAARFNDFVLNNSG